MVIIDTIIISSCSEVIISAPRVDELVVMTHVNTTVKVKDNLLMIHHKGEKKIQSSPRPWPIRFLCYMIMVLYLSLFDIRMVIPLVVVVIIVELVSLPSVDTRTAYCNCCSHIDQTTSNNNIENYITHHIHNKHSINSIITRGLGDVSIGLTMNPVSHIVSSGSGDLSLVTKERFSNLSVKVRREGNISLGNAIVDEAELISEGSGVIHDIYIEVSGLFTITGRGDIIFKRSKECILDKTMIRGHGKLREIL